MTDNEVKKVKSQMNRLRKLRNLALQQGRRYKAQAIESRISKLGLLLALKGGK